VRIIPNPDKEALNRRKHGLDFARVGEILANPCLDEPDDRPLGYEHEGRLKVTGRIGMRVFVLVVEPVEIEGDEIAWKPISLRDATRAEERDYWSWCR
jgi:uncharacterized DUF497 family protein